MLNCVKPRTGRKNSCSGCGKPRRERQLKEQLEHACSQGISVGKEEVLCRLQEENQRLSREQESCSLSPRRGQAAHHTRAPQELFVTTVHLKTQRDSALRR